MSRRAILLGTVAVALASPALAADPYYPKVPAGSPLYQPASVIMAHIDVFGGFISASGTSASGSGGVLGATARVNIPLHDQWNLQVDLDGVGTSGSSASNLTHTELSGNAYLYARMPGWNLGGFVSVVRQASQERTSWFGGPVIGVAVYDRFYVGAHAALGVVNDTGASGSMLQAGINARYEITSNAMLRGDLMYTNITGIPSASYNVVTAALTGEYRFDNSPWGLFAVGRWDCYSGDASASTVQALLGATLYFDPPGSTLDDQWERGPNWRIPRLAYHM